MSNQEGSVAIFWDYENCELPASAEGFSVASGISSIAHQYGSVKVFKAYFDMSELNSQRKDVADKMMLVDMLAYAIDNPAPSTIVLISGDRDFVYAVSILRLRKYQVVVIAPTAAHASLKAQASAVYDWPRHVLPPDVGLDAAWAAHDGLSNARTGLFTPPDSARATPTSAKGVPSYFPSTLFHKGSGHHSASSAPPRGGTVHHRATASTSSTASGCSSMSRASFQSYSMNGAYAGSAASVMKDENGLHDLSNHMRESSVASSSRSPWPATATHDSVGPCDLNDPSSYVSLDEDAPRSQASALPGANAGSSPTTGTTPLVPQPYTSTTVGLPGLDNAEAPVEAPHTVPTVSMTRLRAPSSKFKALVTVLERERLLGNTRVAFSQLGSMLRAEDQSVYRRAGAKQLRDYAATAEEEGIVILGTSDWENGNRWTALHPTYHGKPPEAQTQQPTAF